VDVFVGLGWVARTVLAALAVVVVDSEFFARVVESVVLTLVNDFVEVSGFEEFLELVDNVEVFFFFASCLLTGIVAARVVAFVVDLVA
jgi:hypothetical protein